MAWYYRYETKGIQAWILDSNRLRDLLGGSELVERLTSIAERRAEEAGADEILQSTSGAMMARFPSQESLERFASLWPMMSAQLAPGLQVVQAWGPDPKTVFERLAERRNAHHLTDSEVGPWVARAGRSGLPAIPKPSTIRSDARNTALDAVAIVKEQARSQALKQSSSGGPATGGLPWSRFESESDDWDEPAAVIHADGSGIGQILMNLKEGRHRPFSIALQQSTMAATRAAFEAIAEGRRAIQARPIVSAGDDVTCIVPAGQARRFCETWLRTFEAETGKRSSDLTSRLFGGAGIAIVHPSYPFADAYAHAEELCKKAKTRLKHLERQASILAFERITNSLTKNLGDSGLGWILDDEHPDLLATLTDAVRELPRGTLRTWLTSFERGDEGSAGQLWERAREVAEAKGTWTRFKEALRLTGADPDTGRLTEEKAAVLLSDKGRATPVRDALVLRQLETPQLAKAGVE